MDTTAFVSLLNEVGISHVQNGKIGEAVRCFRRALSRVNGGSSLFSNSSEKGKIANTNTPPPLSSSMRVEVDSTSDSDSELILAVDDADASKSDNNNSNKALYVYQRDEYDEGMYAYSLPVHIDGTCEDDTGVSATILYNLGQGLVRQGHYEEALDWFQRALTDIQGSQQKLVGAVNAVAIQHNIGHCCYRLGQYDEAMKHYHNALVAVCGLGLCELDLAASLNCIAILYFQLFKQG